MAEVSAGSPSTGDPLRGRRPTGSIPDLRLYLGGVPCAGPSCVPSSRCSSPPPLLPAATGKAPTGKGRPAPRPSSCRARRAPRPRRTPTRRSRPKLRPRSPNPLRRSRQLPTGRPEEGPIGRPCGRPMSPPSSPPRSPPSRLRHRPTRRRPTTRRRRRGCGGCWPQSWSAPSSRSHSCFEPGAAPPGVEQLSEAEAELGWVARELLPGLRRVSSREQVAGGWAVALPRVTAAEDRLTVLESSAFDDGGRDRTRALRDASRLARARMEQLVEPGPHDTWALDLDAVMADLEAALGPPRPAPA